MNDCNCLLFHFGLETRQERTTRDVDYISLSSIEFLFADKQ